MRLQQDKIVRPSNTMGGRLLILTLTALIIVGLASVSMRLANEAQAKSEQPDTRQASTPTARATAQVTATRQSTVTATVTATATATATIEATDEAVPTATVAPTDAASAVEATPTATPDETATDARAQESATDGDESAATTTAPLNDEQLIDRGQALYASYCAACHQLDGEGVAGAYPPLAGNPFVSQEDATPVVTVVLTGRAGMPHFQDYLTDQELAAVISYVRSGWQNDAAPVSMAQVQTIYESIHSAAELVEHDGSNVEQ